VAVQARNRVGFIEGSFGHQLELPSFPANRPDFAASGVLGNPVRPAKLTKSAPFLAKRIE